MQPVRLVCVVRRLLDPESTTEVSVSPRRVLLLLAQHPESKHGANSCIEALDGLSHTSSFPRVYDDSISRDVMKLRNVVANNN
jgi:hypothetical protein